jgi:hypothetical protein
MGKLLGVLEVFFTATRGSGVVRQQDPRSERGAQSRLPVWITAGNEPAGSRGFSR